MKQRTAAEPPKDRRRFSREWTGAGAFCLFLRVLTAVLAAVLALTPITGARALTLYTASSFAGEDDSAVTYVNLLKAFEAEHGCVISDQSSASSERWKQSVQERMLRKITRASALLNIW